MSGPFRPGQKVRCINDRGWFDWRTGKATPGPAAGAVCEVALVDVFGTPGGEGAFLGLTGFDPLRLYDARCFRSLDEVDRLAELIAKTPIRARELAGLLL